MRKFGRTTDQRKAFLKALAANLVINEKIKTTEPRAKDLKAHVERLVSYAKKNTLASRRLVSSMLPKNAEKKLFKEIAPRYLERNGGCTRITRLGQRLSDGAKMVFIEFLK